MKFELAPSFKGDYRRLSQGERERFQRVVNESFIEAVKARAADPTIAWPARLRVRSIVGSKAIWEMTWSFAGPDGRATFEWVSIEGVAAIRWRRIGSHDIDKRP